MEGLSEMVMSLDETPISGSSASGGHNWRAYEALHSSILVDLDKRNNLFGCGDSGSHCSEREKQNIENWGGQMQK
ncbi:hypothetical protein O6P43_003397 [Quillaja saponaria]|uniref:Uncharacterized protein n=1 Tax=Quillaja saponaria TaxID=32244 RepID=A0AAD7VLE5_QUISA|nr:hypothetical protein O6P43_003397 [Quillaja saponaria]